MLDPHDHRELGRRLDLFHFQEEAPGMVFWHPKGFEVYRRLEEAIRRVVRADGFQEVRTPQLLRQPIWVKSGHWQSFRGEMFVLDEEPGAIKPVSCPGHLQLLERAALSSKQLPYRLCEFGLVHRNEPSGALHGLFRLRQFTQDDGHIACEEAHVASEVAAFCASLRRFYGAFGFQRLRAAFSSRPAQRAGSDEAWDRAEELLASAAEQAGLRCEQQPGQGAFYGPKLEFSLEDRAGRAWQCGTIQLDLVMPERFGLACVAPGGARFRPVLLHRALLGSLERFLGVLLEHHRGALPAWLAPVQVRVASVGEAQGGYAEAVHQAFERAGLHCELDARDVSVSRKASDVREACIPFFVLVGAREHASQQVSVRPPSGSPRNEPLDAAVRALAEACRPPV